MEEGLISIIIDGKTHQVKPGENLLATCIALGYDLPYFCYHPAMGSVGACRQCAVIKYKDANDTKGRIIMSCMEPLVNGMIISIENQEAKDFRKSVVEGLMLNHPHDCPVCDEGGECHLQDMTIMTGHTYRRNDFKKRTHTNQYLGSFIHHEMNRCIQCYRCVRFYKGYAGGQDFDVFASHDNVYFGRHEEGVLENEFSGNLVEVCPTGVFTDKTSRKHFTRKWDLTNTPSICVHCSVGCNTIGSERYGSLRRIMSRYNGAVNGYFLCDRGRFGYEFVNGENRILKPQVRLLKKEEQEVITDIEVPQILNKVIHDSKKLIGIGSPRASLESNFALLTFVGKENFYSGVSSQEYNLTKLALSLLKEGPFHSPSLSEIGKADAVIILGEDITNTAPMIALAVRQASRTVPVKAAVDSGIPEWHDSAIRDHMQDIHSPIINAVSYSTKLDDVANNNFKGTSSEIADFGFSIASNLDKNAHANHQSGSINDMASSIAEQLKESKNPIVITGTQSGSATILHAAANIARALSVAGKNVGLCIVLPESNSMGLALMEAKPLEDALKLVNESDESTVVVLENDLYKRSEKEKIDNLMQKSKVLISLDHTSNITTKKAHVLLPVGTFAESEGTLVNNEGRAQRFYKVIPPGKSPIESWRLLGEMIKIKKGDGLPEKDLSSNTSRSKDILKEGIWETLDDVIADMCNAFPVFSKIKEYLPHEDFRIYNEKINRQTKRFSGRTANNANINVSENRPPDDPDSPLAFTMEGAAESKPSSLVPYYWRPGWNSYQAQNFYLDKPDGSMKGGDPGIRLIEQKEQPGILYFEPAIKSEVLKEDEWLLLPVYQIFGSEELSSLAPAITERIQKPFLLTNRKDALSISKYEGDLLTLQIGNTTIDVVIKFDDRIPPRTAGLSINLPGMDYIELPAKITVVTNKKG